MKVEIDIDTSKIDYNEINKQIKEKLEVLTPQDIFNRYYKTDDDINEYIENILREGSEQYIVSQGWMSSSKSKDEINKIAKAIMIEMLKPEVEKVMHCLSNDELNGLLFELFPYVLCDVLYNKMNAQIDLGYMKNRQDREAHIRSIIENRLRR